MVKVGLHEGIAPEGEPKALMVPNRTANSKGAGEVWFRGWLSVWNRPVPRINLGKTRTKAILSPALRFAQDNPVGQPRPKLGNCEKQPGLAGHDQLGLPSLAGQEDLPYEPVGRDSADLHPRAGAAGAFR